MEERIRNIGARIRQIRLEKNMTLKDISKITNLSMSLISMIERGEANPSIGSLIAISSALQVSIGDLANEDPSGNFQPVVRRNEQAVIYTSKGVSHRILILTENNQLQMVENIYAPGTSSSHVATRHRGKEFGVLIEGHLQVEIQDKIYDLEPGDAICFDSHYPHRYINNGNIKSRSIWVNIFSE